MNLPILIAQSAVTAEQVAARAAEQEQAFGAVVVFVLLIFVIFGYMLPFAIVLRHLFQLAGRPGRAAFIPGYNFIVLGDIAKAPGLAKVVIASMALVPVPIVIFGALPAFLITAAVLVKKLFDQYDQTISFWMWLVFAPFIAVFKMKEVAYSGLLAMPANAFIVPERAAPSVAVFGSAVASPLAPPPIAASAVPGVPLAAPLYAPPSPVVSPLTPAPEVAPAAFVLPPTEAEEGPLLPPAFTHSVAAAPVDTGPVYLPAVAVPEPVYVAPPDPLPAALPASVPQATFDEQLNVAPQPDPGIVPLPPAAFVPSVEDAFMRPAITQSSDPYTVAAQQDIAAALQAPTEPAVVYTPASAALDGVAPSVTGVSLADLDALYGHDIPPSVPDAPLEPVQSVASDISIPAPEPEVEIDTSDLIDPATLAPPVVMQPDMPVAEAPPEPDDMSQDSVTDEPVSLPDSDYQDSDGVLHIDHHHD